MAQNTPDAEVSNIPRQMSSPIKFARFVFLLAAVSLLVLALVLAVVTGTTADRADARAVAPTDNTLGPGPDQPQVAGVPNVPAGCGWGWWETSSPNPSSSYNYFEGVAAVSSTDVWAVGGYSDGSNFSTLIEHWNGSPWVIAPSPNVGSNNSILNGVTAVSSSDVWAVGYYNTSSGTQTLVEHWDGSAWSVVPSPNPSAENNLLYGVVAISSSDVWAVGTYNNPGLPMTLQLVEHWDGTAWSVVVIPNPVGSDYALLQNLAAVSSTDVWAVGRKSIGNNAANQTLVEHWNGTAWSVVVSPNPVGSSNAYFNGVAAVSSNDVWAVGRTWNQDGHNQVLTEHWDGTVWSIIASPPNPFGSDGADFSGVAAVSSNDVWAVGAIYYSESPSQVLTEHWDGTAWSVYASELRGLWAARLNGVAASSTDVWAVGFAQPQDQGVITVAAKYYDNCSGEATATPVIATSTPVTPTATPTPCTGFSDVQPGSPFYPYITCLVSRGVISGYNDCTFRPNVVMTRGQFAKVVSSAAGYNDDVTGRQTYADVPSTNPFWLWIERLSLHEVMGGYNCGGPNEPCDEQNRPYFRWSANVTRGQTSKIVSNAAGFLDDPPDQFFADVPSSNVFFPFIQRLATRGIMGGYPCGGEGEPCDDQQRPYFRWGNNVTRGQASKIVANTFFPSCNSESGK